MFASNVCYELEKLLFAVISSHMSDDVVFILIFTFIFSCIFVLILYKLLAYMPSAHSTTVILYTVLYICTEHTMNKKFDYGFCVKNNFKCSCDSMRRIVFEPTFITIRLVSCKSLSICNFC